MFNRNRLSPEDFERETARFQDKKNQLEQTYTKNKRLAIPISHYALCVKSLALIRADSSDVYKINNYADFNKNHDQLIEIGKILLDKVEQAQGTFTPASEKNLRDAYADLERIDYMRAPNIAPVPHTQPTAAVESDKQSETVQRLQTASQAFGYIGMFAAIGGGIGAGLGKAGGELLKQQAVKKAGEEALKKAGGNLVEEAAKIVTEETLKNTAKEFLTATGKEMTEEALKRATEQAAKEAIKKVAAETAVKEFGKKVTAVTVAGGASGMLAGYKIAQNNLTAKEKDAIKTPGLNKQSQ